MKSIILAAGRGTRLDPYTRNRPKCLLRIGGRSLLQWQVDLLREADFEDITIVKGFAQDSILVEGAKYYINDNYESTNMVHSLFCAKPELGGEVLISYADIVYDHSILEAALNTSGGDIGVVVDVDWAAYYRERYGDALAEAESLIIDGAGRIRRIGEPNPSSKDVQGRYVGLIKLTSEGTRHFTSVYDDCNEAEAGQDLFRGRSLQQLQMTDFLQLIIDRGIEVHAIPVHNGWIELDTVADYECALAWWESGSIQRFCNLPWYGALQNEGGWKSGE